MKKITKVIVAILLMAIMFTTNVPGFASAAQVNETNGITPRLSHTEDGTFSFAASSSGGSVEVFYFGYSSFVRADLTIKIEKRFLLVFWNEVSSWSASSTEREGHFYNVMPLDGSGYYRATFTLVVTGSNGTTDTITDTIESQY